MRSALTFLLPRLRHARRAPGIRLAALALLFLALLASAAPARAGKEARVTEIAGSDESAEWLMNGTWSAGRESEGDDMWISLRNDNRRGSRHEHGRTLEPDKVEGFDPRAIGAGRQPVDFRIRRDAGVVHANGVFSGHRGAGTFELELDPAFAAALEKRGVGRPTREQQARLLLGDAKLALLDVLARERYAMPRVSLFVRMTDHGVTGEFVSGLARYGYRLDSLDELVQARDHGADPEFIRSLAEAGYRNLDFATVIRARDHGANGEYIQDLAEAGFEGLALERVIQARDHGVDGGFIASLRRAGFEKLTLEDAIRARDHGVTSGYARRMRERRPDVTLSELIALRDRGVQP